MVKRTFAHGGPGRQALGCQQRLVAAEVDSPHRLRVAHQHQLDVACEGPLGRRHLQRVLLPHDGRGCGGGGDLLQCKLRRGRWGGIRVLQLPVATEGGAGKCHTAANPT